jgi:phosphatidylglycerophosphatase C
LNDDAPRGGAEAQSAEAELASERAPAGGVSPPAASERKRKVAAFDFDKTLSTRDNVLPFVRHAVGPARLAAGLVRSSPRLVAATLDSRRRDAAKAALVRHTLTGFDEATFLRAAAEFADVVRAAHLRADVVERVDWHRAQGHETVIVSASFRDYLEPVAHHLGVDGVLATELEVRDGRLTGRLAGANVRGTEKVRRLDAWLGPGEVELWAYGDSSGDDALLARADHPVRV